MPTPAHLLIGTLLLALHILGRDVVADDDPLYRYALTVVDSGAVCNDGSPSVYFHRPGLGANATRWVIRFQGGAWCWDVASCDARMLRTPYLMSSNLVPPSTSAYAHAEGIPDVVLRPDGILSRDPERNPLFSTWAHVYVWYCSSDSHLGDAPAGLEKTGRWQFRGKRSTAALVRHLIDEHGLSDATDVLITGDSAGGVAALNNADFMESILSPVARNLQRFKTFVDAGWFLDIPSYSDSVDAFTFRMAAKSLQNKWNASFDRTCQEAFGREAWRCFHAQYAACHVPTPLLFHQYIYDSANLGYDQASFADFPDFREHFLESFGDAGAPPAPREGPRPPPKDDAGGPSGGGVGLSVSGAAHFGDGHPMGGSASASVGAGGVGLGSTVIDAGLATLGGIASEVVGQVETGGRRVPTYSRAQGVRASPEGAGEETTDSGMDPAPAPVPRSWPVPASTQAALRSLPSPNAWAPHNPARHPHLLREGRTTIATAPSPTQSILPTWTSSHPATAAPLPSSTTLPSSTSATAAPSPSSASLPSSTSSHSPSEAPPPLSKTTISAQQPTPAPAKGPPSELPAKVSDPGTGTHHIRLSLPGLLGLSLATKQQVALAPAISGPDNPGTGETPRQATSSLWAPGALPSVAGGVPVGRRSGAVPALHADLRDATPLPLTTGGCRAAGNFAMFAPACHLHEVIDSDLFAFSHIGSVDLTGVLGNWFWDRGGAAGTRVEVDGYAGLRPAGQCEPTPVARPVRTAHMSEQQAQEAMDVDQAWSETILGLNV